MYHQNGHALIQRICQQNGKEHKEEYYLAPGQGILFYKLGKAIIGDKFEIFKKAQKAIRHNLIEILGIHDEHDGLVMSPTLNHHHANTAYHDSQHNQSKLSASLIKADNTIKYIGSISQK